MQKLHTITRGCPLRPGEYLQTYLIAMSDTEGLAAWVTAPRLRVDERYNSRSRGLEVGGSTTRAVHVTADDTTSMMNLPVEPGIPPLNPASSGP